MSLNRYAARTDANQKAIIAGLQAAGCVVWVIRVPVDLLVGVNVLEPGKARWLPMEIKSSAKAAKRPTKLQREFMSTAGYLPHAYVSDVEGALRAVLAISE